jgi:predicted hydrocarbon binding protein
MPSNNRSQQVVLPARALAAIGGAIAEVIGPEAAAEALRAAGHAAGDAFHGLLAERHDLAGLPAAEFWATLSQLFSSRGWGQLRYREAHPGVGSLETVDWAEARPEEALTQPSCHFTTGLLANLLGRIAGEEVAVLEVECRSRGDERCRFLFGSPDALFALYERVADGEGADRALEQLAG